MVKSSSAGGRKIRTVAQPLADIRLAGSMIGGLDRRQMNEPRFAGYAARRKRRRGLIEIAREGALSYALHARERLRAREMERALASRNGFASVAATIPASGRPRSTVTAGRTRPGAPPRRFRGHLPRGHGDRDIVDDAADRWSEVLIEVVLVVGRRGEIVGQASLQRVGDGGRRPLRRECKRRWPRPPSRICPG